MALLPVLAKSRPAANPLPGRDTQYANRIFKLRDISPATGSHTLSSVCHDKSRSGVSASGSARLESRNIDT